MQAFLAHNPLAVFALLLGLSVVVPPLVQRLRLPDLVGLLLAGLLIGPHGLGWLADRGETVRLLSELGVVFLLFIAGLEIDLAEFARIRQRSFRFGLLTFSLPMLGGLGLGLAFGYPWLSAVLLGSILSSHTPLGYPIVRSYGAMRDEAVTVAIGGTIFTDIAALVVLAICMGMGRGDFSATSLIGLLVRIAVYGTLVVGAILKLGRLLVHRCAVNEDQLFVPVLLALFAAALGAELAGVEKIVGAFLAGLAVNAVLAEGRVKDQVIHVGATLFIPIFFIDLGLLLDVPVFMGTLVGSLFALLLILTLVGSKGLAAWWAGRVYRYDSARVLTLWSLSLPQVAATLAATFVGFRAGLLDQRVLNSVMALMVVTATLGPYLTAVAMPRLGRAAAAGLNADTGGQLALVRRALRVLVPVANPASEDLLITLAGLLSNGDGDQQEPSGRVLPLAVVAPQPGSMALGQQRLRQAEVLAASQGLPCRTLLRVDSDRAAGIAATALEQGADLVLMGMGAPSRLGRWLFGDLEDATCRLAHCPVVVARLPAEPAGLQRLLVPIKDLTAAALEQFQLAERIAHALGSSITLLHRHDPHLSEAGVADLREQLQRWRPQADSRSASTPVSIELHRQPSVEAAILGASRRHDLVILRSQRRLVAGLPIPASDRVQRLLERLEGPVLVISDPLH